MTSSPLRLGKMLHRVIGMIIVDLANPFFVELMGGVERLRELRVIP